MAPFALSIEAAAAEAVESTAAFAPPEHAVRDAIAIIAVRKDVRRIGDFRARGRLQRLDERMKILTMQLSRHEAMSSSAQKDPEGPDKAL
jgi:hypothetical protein